MQSPNPLGRSHSPRRGTRDLYRSLSDVGDYIGMESCVDLNQSEDSTVNRDRAVDDSRPFCHGKRDPRWTMRREKREYPPPIPCLARTENLPSHMPWVMRRYYTSDGRLIIREEKVKHHEYFRAHRSNGRLTLQLVPLDDTVLALPRRVVDNADNAMIQPVEGGRENDDDDENGKDGGDEVVVGGEGEQDQTVVMGEGGGGGGKGCKYNNSNNNSVRVNSCIFGLPVPAARPVHI